MSGPIGQAPVTRTGVIAACIKWVDRRPDVDPLTGEVVHDPRSAGASDADDAALEWALRIGERWGLPVLAITAGPPEADQVVRSALAAGASRAMRVAEVPDASSAAVAAALAAALPSDVTLAVCGNWSIDRGSGAVPAFLAAHLDAAQALGLVSIEPGLDAKAGIRADRRLDGGRREALHVPAPAVISVEGGSARLRRAPLARVVAYRTAAIEVVAASPSEPAVPPKRAPLRPRPRSRPAPASASARERILELTGALSDPTPPQRLVLEPAAAASRLVDQLRAWGYLE